MSAIAGLVQHDPPESGAAGLRSMMAALAHRPHVGATSRTSGVASFGLLRSVADPRPAAREPLRGAAGLLVTADLRLDNRDDLIRILEADVETPDEALVLGAYERWGAACPEHLVGAFALAVWDEGARTLFCARDPQGMKPLFYAVQGSVVAFASEIRALLALPGIPRILNASKVCDHLLGLPGDGRQTMYRGVFRLPAAHTATFAPGQPPRLRRYWRLDAERQLPPGTGAEYTEMFRAAFAEAVRCRLRGAAPVGATLSGGLDSSAVVCVARSMQRGAEPVHAFSGRFSEVPACDEGPFIESVREAGGVVSHDVPGDAVGPFAALESVAEHLDEPCLIQNVHLWAGVYRAASAHGVRVVLDGHDGDTTISHDLPRVVPAPGPHTTLRSVARALLRRSPVLRRLRQRLRPSRDEVPEAVRIMDRGFARAHDARERLEAEHRGRREAIAAGGRALHLRRLTSNYPVYASEFIAQLGCLFGVEPRHPFYDRRLLELCLALPSDLKRRDGLSRYVLREALRGVVPERVRLRPDKTSLGPQFHRGFCTRDREAVARALVEGRERLEPFVDLERVEQLRRAYLEEPTDGSSVVLWGVASLALWLQRSGVSARGQ